MNVRPEDVYDMERRMAGHEFSLDPVVDVDSEENSYNPVRYLAAEGAEPTEVLEGVNMERLHSEGLDLALASLDERSLAAELGVSAERVRQIETQAMKKMKTALLKYEQGEV